MAHRLAADNHQLGKAVAFMEEGGADPGLLAERLSIKKDYAAWLLTHARKMRSGTNASKSYSYRNRPR